MELTTPSERFGDLACSSMIRSGTMTISPATSITPDTSETFRIRAPRVAPVPIAELITAEWIAAAGMAALPAARKIQVWRPANNAATAVPQMTSKATTKEISS
ncbi:hypothetical protein ABIF05_005616 [Bradyrhizobium elkanii]